MADSSASLRIIQLRHFLVCCLPWLALGSLVLAGIRTSRYNITAQSPKGKVEYLTAQKGRLTLGESSGLKRENEDAADHWYVLGTKIKSSVGEGYLAYDETGKDATVVLSAKADAKGTEWLIKCPRDRKRKNERASLDEEWGTIQAAAGPMKGWFLDIEEVEKTVAGKTATVRRLVLSKSPRWNIEAGRIYIHK